MLVCWCCPSEGTETSVFFFCFVCCCFVFVCRRFANIPLAKDVDLKFDMFLFSSQEDFLAPGSPIILKIWVLHWNEGWFFFPPSRTLTSLNIYDKVCVIMICICLNGAVDVVGVSNVRFETMQYRTFLMKLWDNNRELHLFSGSSVIWNTKLVVKCLMDLFLNGSCYIEGVNAENSIA